MTITQNQILDLDGVALIVFSGETDIRWLRLLKHGFRHCFACVYSRGQWVFYDPLAHMTSLSVCTGMDSVDLEFWFRQQGCQVVRTMLQPVRRKKCPPALFTCVEAIKRLLGVQDFFVLTPWQLFKHLKTARR